MTRDVYVTPDTPGIEEGRGWVVVTWDELDHVHVIPENDLIEHSEDNDGECVCGPTVQYAEETNRWLIIHDSLDGRELTEPDRTT